MLKAKINYFDALETVRKNYQNGLPKQMAVAANRVRSRMMNSLAKRNYSKKGKKPAPAPAGSPPHAIGIPGEGVTKTGRPKRNYRIRQIQYAKMGPLTYAVGVAPFAGGGSHIMEVPKLHETGGGITRTRNAYHGNKHGQRKKISQKAKDAYRRKMRQAFAENDEMTLRRLKIWKDTKTYHYPRRPYLEPAAKKAAQELPQLFTFAAYVR